jgi:hypothetical protein
VGNYVVDHVLLPEDDDDDDHGRDDRDHRDRGDRDRGDRDRNRGAGSSNAFFDGSDGKRIGGRVYNLMLSDSDDLAVIQKSHASANDDILGPRA